MYEVTMPKLTDSMEEGKIVAWKVQKGDAVEEGDVLAEIESDKAVMELECFKAGTVAEILQGDGAEVAVGETIARIAVEGEEVEAAGAAEESPEKGEEAEEAKESEEAAPAEAAEQEGAPQDAQVEVTIEEEAAGDEEAAGTVEVEAPPGAEQAERVNISDFARKIAADKGVDYTQIEGTGEGGRITAKDVARAAGEESRVLAVGAGKRPAAEAPAKAEAEAGEEPEARPEGRPEEELPPLEVTDEEAEVQKAPFRLKTQARRVIASQHIIPHFYVTRGADVTELMHMKGEIKEQQGATLTHVVALACLKALADHPNVNRSYDHGRVINWKHVNLGYAVDTEQGLTVAVLQRASELSFRKLVEQTTELVEKARAGKLSGQERKHATFTITNLGPMDVEHFEPIINPPSSVTLAVSSALPTAVVREEAIVLGQVMKLTAACDHRIIDGATAARFLQGVRQRLEAPAALLEEE